MVCTASDPRGGGPSRNWRRPIPLSEVGEFLVAPSRMPRCPRRVVTPRPFHAIVRGGAWVFFRLRKSSLRDRLDRPHAQSSPKAARPLCGPGKKKNKTKKKTKKKTRMAGEIKKPYGEVRRGPRASGTNGWRQAFNDRAGPLACPGNFLIWCLANVAGGDLVWPSESMRQRFSATKQTTTLTGIVLPLADRRTICPRSLASRNTSIPRPPPPLLDAIAPLVGDPPPGR